jgi:hypothetical protein
MSNFFIWLMRAYHEMFIPGFYINWCLCMGVQQLDYVANCCVREFVSSQSGVTPAEISHWNDLHHQIYNNKFLTELAQGCYNVLYLRKVAGIGPTDFATYYTQHDEKALSAGMLCTRIYILHGIAVRRDTNWYILTRQSSGLIFDADLSGQRATQVNGQCAS